MDIVFAVDKDDMDRFLAGMDWLMEHVGRRGAFECQGVGCTVEWDTNSTEHGEQCVVWTEDAIRDMLQHLERQLADVKGA